MTTVITDSAGRKFYFPEDNMDVIDYEPLEGRELVAATCGHVFAKATLQDDWMGKWKKTACPVCNGLIRDFKVVKLPEPVPVPPTVPVPVPVVIPAPVPVVTPVGIDVPAPAAAIKVENSPKKVETIKKVSNIFYSVIKVAIPLTLIAMAIGLFVCQIISSFSKKK